MTTPVFIIAEIGVNHDGDPARALSLVDGAARAGADAVKFQFFNPDFLMSAAARLAAYQAGAGERDPHAMLRRLMLTHEQLAAAAARARALGLKAGLTIFSVELVRRVDPSAWDFFKTASPDIVHRPLLEAVAKLGRPMVISTGASERDEVVRATRWLNQTGVEWHALQCVSSYPTRDEDAALGVIADIASITGRPAGYSDHTESERAGAAATAAGAVTLEKHLTYDRAARGPDHRASLDEVAFGRYVRAVRVRSVTAVPPLEPKTVLECERDVRSVSRQSIVTTRELHAGDRLRVGDITFKRPGTGVPPWRADEVVGRTLARDVVGDSPLSMEDFA